MGGKEGFVPVGIWTYIITYSMARRTHRLPTTICSQDFKISISTIMKLDTFILGKKFHIHERSSPSCVNNTLLRYGFCSRLGVLAPSLPPSSGAYCEP